jgi:hypothetical protein
MASTMWKIKISAQACTDASNVAYGTYSIPEPVSFSKYREELAALNRLPQKSTAWGADPDVLVPTRFAGMDLKRGAAPIELTVCQEQLDLMRSDKKNLLIFDETKVDTSKSEARASR